MRSGHGSRARWLQWQHTSGATGVQQSSQHDPWRSQARASNGRNSESFSQHWAAVPIISVSRWSRYPSVQTWGFGHSGPIPRAFPLHLITSVLGSAPLDITVMADIDSIWIVRKCPKSLLSTAASQETD